MDCITVRRLVSKYHHELNWTLRKNEIHGIVGPSGEGKSYFLKILLGLLPYASGEMLDEHGEHLDLEKAAIGAQFQSNALLNTMTIGENIMMPLVMKLNMKKEYAEVIAKHYMELVGLNLKAFDYYPMECSGGMQKKAALASVLVSEPKILLLDEPTAGLDCVVLETYDNLLLDLSKKKGITIAMVTHDISRLAKIANRISVMVGGVFHTGTIKELMKSDNVTVREFLESYVRTTATF